MGAKQPEFTVFDPAVAIANLSSSLAEALDFATRKDHAAFERVDDFIVVPGTTIGGYDAIALIVGLGRSASLLHSFRTGHPCIVPSRAKLRLAAR